MTRPSLFQHSRLANRSSQYFVGIKKLEYCQDIRSLKYLLTLRDPASKETICNNFTNVRGSGERSYIFGIFALRVTKIYRSSPSGRVIKNRLFIIYNLFPRTTSGGSAAIELDSIALQ